MELQLTRTTLTPESTIGDLYINGKWQCYILEDADRGLSDKMSVEEILINKIKYETAVPTGKYEIVISYSNKFKKKLPLLMNVPGFEGIRIHPGNSKSDTSGCLLPGNNIIKDRVTNSKDAFNELFSKIEKAVEKEKIFITIVNMKSEAIVSHTTHLKQPQKKGSLPLVFKKGSV